MLLHTEILCLIAVTLCDHQKCFNSKKFPIYITCTNLNAGSLLYEIFDVSGAAVTTLL